MNSFFVKFIMWGIPDCAGVPRCGGCSPYADGLCLPEETFEAGKRSVNISFVITVVLSLSQEFSYGKQRLRIRTQRRT